MVNAPNQSPIMKSGIVEDYDNIGLEDNMQSGETMSGDHFVASTDKGLEYKPNGFNEDAVVLMPEHNAFAVIDGMGGHNDGDIASTILAMAILGHPNDINKAVKIARKNLDRQQLGRAGCCFNYFKIVEEGGEKFIDIYWIGDVKACYYVNGKSKPLYATRDDSSVQDKIDRGEISEEEATYNADGHLVKALLSESITNAQLGTKPNFASINHERIRVKPDSTLAVTSDGIIGSNLTPEEFGNEVVNSSNSPEDMIQKIDLITTMRMSRADIIQMLTKQNGGRKNMGHYNDGYLMPPTPDNRSAVIVQF